MCSTAIAAHSMMKVQALAGASGTTNVVPMGVSLHSVKSKL